MSTAAPTVTPLKHRFTGIRRTRTDPGHQTRTDPGPALQPTQNWLLRGMKKKRLVIATQCRPTGRRVLFTTTTTNTTSSSSNTNSTNSTNSSSSNTTNCRPPHAERRWQMLVCCKRAALVLRCGRCLLLLRFTPPAEHQHSAERVAEHARA